MKRISAEKDFTADMLPSTRKGVFLDRVKLQYGKLLKIGLILFAFCLPLFTVSVLKDLGAAAVYAEYEAGSVDSETARLLINSANNIYGLISVGCFALLSPAVAGCLGVIKRLAWLEPVFFGADFRDGIKSGWIICLAVFTVFGLFAFFCDRALSLIDNFILSALPSGILIAVFLPVMFFMLMQNCVYNVKIFECTRNGFALYLKSAPKTLLAVIISASPTLLFLIGNIILKYLLLALAATFILPLIMLGLFLYGSSVLDANINKSSFPELYGRGLRQKNDKE